MTFHRCFLPSFGSFGQTVSGEEFQKSANQKQESPVAAMSVNRSGQNEQSLAILVTDRLISKNLLL
jgi:hypothetical protein